MQRLQRRTLAKFDALQDWMIYNTVGRNNEGEVHDATKVDFMVLEDIEDVLNCYVETSCRISLLR